MNWVSGDSTSSGGRVDCGSSELQALRKLIVTQPKSRYNVFFIRFCFSYDVLLDLFDFSAQSYTFFFSLSHKFKRILISLSSLFPRNCRASVD